MRTFHVVIRGTKPILLHNPAGMITTSSGKKVIPTPEDEAAKGCYWLPDKSSLCFPADNLQASLIVVAPQYKVGKVRLSPYVSGSIDIMPPYLTFGTKEYEIDTRRAIIQRQGVMRSRPRLNDWALTFDILVDDDFPGTNPGAVIKQMLDEAGRRVGIGDFRPQRKGKFGKFVVEYFEEKS